MVLKRVFDDSDAGADMRRRVDDAGRATDARAGVAAGMKAAAEAVRPRRAAARASISSGERGPSCPSLCASRTRSAHDESASVHKVVVKREKEKPAHEETADEMVTAQVEVRRRQLSLAAGVLFGVGWLLFIDAIVTFNGAAPFRSSAARAGLFALVWFVWSALGWAAGGVLAGAATDGAWLHTGDVANNSCSQTYSRAGKLARARIPARERASPRARELCRQAGENVDPRAVCAGPLVRSRAGCARLWVQRKR